jgi:hypothetical protein
MTTFRLIILFFIVPCYSIAQDSNSSKWSIGVNASIDYNYRKLSTANSNPYTDIIIPNRNNIEHPKLGYTTGLAMQYQITPKLALATGVNYSLKGYETKNLSYRFLDDSSQYVYAPAYQGFIFKYIDVPLQLRMTTGNKSVQFVYGFGVNINLLLESRFISDFEYGNYHQNIATTNKYRKLNISPSIYLGVKYTPTAKINIFFEPTLRYQLLKNIDATITERLYNIGLNISTFYRL